MDPSEYASNFLQQVLLESLDWPAERAWTYILQRLDSVADVPITADESHPRGRGVVVARRAVEQQLALITQSAGGTNINDADRELLSQAISSAINHLTEEIGRIRAARPQPQ